MNAWIVAIGWTLIHFVWQGAVLALAAAAGLRLARRRSSNARYLIACTGLAAMLGSPAMTAAIFLAPGTGDARMTAGAAPDRASAPGPAAIPPPGGEPASPGADSITARERLEASLTYVVWGWLAGVLLFLGRFAGGWWQVHQLRRAVLAAPPSRWQEAASRIAGRLRLNIAVRVVESNAIAAPGAIGWIRPVIVLPIAVLTSLTPAQVEAILAHELAHVRRRDYAVNLLQTVAEALLFYHPGVWWISARIREEREHCCDDVAVEVCGEPTAYAEALGELASWESRGAALATGAAGGSVLARIRRLLRAPEADHGPSLSGLLTVALAVLAVAGALLQSVSPVHGEQSQPSAENRRIHNTDHFEISFEPDLDLHAERVAREAERAYERVSVDVRHELAFKVPIVLFRTSSELDHVVQRGPTDRYVHASPGQPVGDRILFAVDRPADEWPGLLTHEVAHVFGFDIIPGTSTPRWMAEGLAEYQRGEWDPGDLLVIRDALRGAGIPTVSDLDAGGNMDPRLADGLGHAAFEFIESRWGKSGVRQFIFGLRQAALKGGDPYQSALRMSRDDFGRAFEQYLKERFAGPGDQSLADRFDEGATIRIEGAITAINSAAARGLACLELLVTVEGASRKWAVECGDELDPGVMGALKPGDRVIVTGSPARRPQTQRVAMRSLTRPADGFAWQARSG
jgi:beta-lactamase regulating signal transducer with metallopeptidase domain